VPGGEVPRLWFSAVCGTLHADTIKTFEALGLTEDKYAFGENDLPGLVELTVTGAIRRPRALRPGTDALFRLDGILPYQLSMLQLGLYRSVKYAGYAEPLLLVAGDTFEDFCLYYCLSRLRDRVVWVLPSITEKVLASSLEKTSRAEMNFVSELNSESRSPRSQGGFACTTYSLTDSQIEAVKSQLSTAGAATHRLPIGRAVRLEDLLRFPLVANERDNLQRDISVQLTNDMSLTPFPTPKPKNFATIHPVEHRYVTQLTITQEMPPKHFHLGKWIIQDHRYTTKEVRVGKEGPAYFCPNVAYFGGDIDSVLVRPRLHLPPLHKVLVEIARTQGYEARPSDKGIYADESIAKWGGLEQLCRFFRDDASRGLLQRFLDTSKSKTGKGVYLDDRRRYLDYGAVQAQVGDAATTIIDELISKQILQRGFVFLCLYCRNASWFSVAEISQEFKCRRCGRSQVYTKAHWKMPDEPTWFYKLDELVDQGYRNGMMVSLLALDHLRLKSPDGFAFATDREFWKAGAAKAEAEADFFCSPDGVLTIGEVKKEGQLGQSTGEESAEIQKYLHLARAFGARQLVFATLSDSWSRRTIQSATRVFSKAPQVRLCFLTATDLLSMTRTG